MPTHVKIVEVGPRDGLQNEIHTITTADKIALVDQLSDTGLSVIEVTSFVSPKWIPQLADGAAVYQGIQKRPGVHYPVLVPNLTGWQHAHAAGVSEIAVFTTPSEAFSQKNTHCSVAESLARVAAVIVEAKKHQQRVRGYVSCVLGCPYEGEMSTQKVVDMVLALRDLGCDEISLGDTIGVGTVTSTKRLLDELLTKVPASQLAVHFHDTYGQALTNIYVALQYGIATVDASVAGLGGCPYAHGASGNVATEDVVYMLHGCGIKTGIDLDKLIQAGRFITQRLGSEPQSKVNLALGGV